MTKSNNKAYQSLRHDYNSLLRTQSDSFVRYFAIKAMELLNNYRVENIQYRERIKTLKEILRIMKEVD